MNLKVLFSRIRIIEKPTITFVPMKNILLTLFAAFLTIGSIYGQKINLSLNNVSLEKSFKEIRKQTGFSFVYTRQQINKAHTVSINVKDASLSQVLDICFNNQPLTFNIDNKYIIVKDRVQENLSPKASYIDITGKVTNTQNEPVVGATITVKQTNVATSSDEDGKFTLTDLKKNDALVITSIGYMQSDVTLNGSTNLIIKLQTNITRLDETVIVAYGKTTRRLNTGNVSTISGEVINQQPVSNPLTAIQGRAPGVFVNTENGLPGGNIQVQIRGKGSINAGTEPLYIIDGIPFISTPLNSTFSTLSDGIGGSTSPFNSINPADIESIEILKDADATAIYGSRAANGVILITTKKGTGGKTKFDFNLYSGFSRLADFPKLLILSEYLKIRKEGFNNDGLTPTVDNAPDLLVWDTTKATDWPKYILGGTAVNTNAQASVSGGSQFTNFLLSGSLRKENTILPGDSKYQRAGIHFALEHTSTNRKFSIKFSSSYSVDKNNLISSNIFSIYTLPPNLPIYDNGGNYNWVGVDGVNPKAILLQKSKSITNNLLSNMILQYEILPNFFVKSSFGYTRIEMDQVLTYPQSSLDPDYGLTSYSYFGNNSNTTFIVEPQLEYSKKIKQSKFKILLGTSWQSSIRNGNFISASDFNNDALLEYVGAAGNITASNIYKEYKYSSIFTRLNYDLKEKYILNVSMRRDGSSRFGPGKQFGNFGAVGGAWLFSKENIFRSLDFLSYGKIRASYGITGNDLINDYQYLSTYGTSGNSYQGVVGLTSLRIANSNFGWENNKKFEAAIELGIIKDKIVITTAWYMNKSGNQLIDYPLPYTSGPFGHYLANLPALIKNTGWEFELNSVLINHNKILWSISGNLSVTKNKLLKYPELESSSFASSYVIGEDLSIKRALHFTGINVQNGLPEYMDVNGDGVISAPEDYKTVGKTSPYYYGGFGSEFKFSRFQLNIFFQYSKQYAQGIATFPGLQYNLFDMSLARWQKPGDITTIGRSTTTPGSEYFNLPQSDAAFYNASYTRLKNLRLSFSISRKSLEKLKLSNCMFYIEGQNLITWRKDNGLFDPETSLLGIPPLKSFVGGFEITF